MSGDPELEFKDGKYHVERELKFLNSLYNEGFDFKKTSIKSAALIYEDFHIYRCNYLISSRHIPLGNSNISYVSPTVTCAAATNVKDILVKLIITRDIKRCRLLFRPDYSFARFVNGRDIILGKTCIVAATSTEDGDVKVDEIKTICSVDNLSGISSFETSRVWIADLSDIDEIIGNRKLLYFKVFHEFVADNARNRKASESCPQSTIYGLLLDHYIKTVKQDVVIKIPFTTKQLTAHSSILSACSRNFTVIENEGEDSYHDLRVPLISDVAVGLFFKLMYFDFIANDHFLEELQGCSDEVFILADKYKVNTIKLLCESMMISKLNKHNLAIYHKVASEYDAEDLKKITEEMMSDYWKEAGASAGLSSSGRPSTSEMTIASNQSEETTTE